MKKWSPLLAAVVGAALLVLQQFVGQETVDLKVVGFAVLIAVIGAVGSFLKGKGVTIGGILGTALYTFYEVWQTGTFTWNEFILSAVIAILTLIAPSLQPSQDNEN